MRRACVTGGAGFIGSNLADRLSVEGVEVVIVDDFRIGRCEFVAGVLKRPGVRLVEGDVLDPAVLDDAVKGCDWVFHLQANADVRHGLEHPRRDLEQNTIATSNVLEAMRTNGVKRIAFSDSLLRLMVVVGITMAGVALLAIPIVAVLKAYNLYRFAQGLATMCILMLFLGGIQFIGMGLLGAYVGRTYEETKQRPKFIVDESVGFDA